MSQYAAHCIRGHSFTRTNLGSTQDVKIRNVRQQIDRHHCKRSTDQRSGEIYEQAANYGFSPEFEEFARRNPIVPQRGTITGRVAVEGKTVHVADVLSDPEFTGNEYQLRGNFRTCLGVPLLRAREVIGVFFLSRSEIEPFTEKQIELVTTFADQAVIAIENVRLFDEVQARTHELQETLEISDRGQRRSQRHLAIALEYPTCTRDDCRDGATAVPRRACLHYEA